MLRFSFMKQKKNLALPSFGVLESVETKQDRTVLMETKLFILTHTQTVHQNTYTVSAKKRHIFLKLFGFLNSSQLEPLLILRDLF